MNQKKYKFLIFSIFILNLFYCTLALAVKDAESGISDDCAGKIKLVLEKALEIPTSEEACGGDYLKEPVNVLVTDINHLQLSVACKQKSDKKVLQSIMKNAEKITDTSQKYGRKEWSETLDSNRKYVQNLYQYYSRAAGTSDSFRFNPSNSKSCMKGQAEQSADQYRSQNQDLSGQNTDAK